ncbi:hypothetical protein DYU11_19845 [Fibrisoma montanum]|uniref:Phage integrase SAM-like domain-containing protein n=1 Tax=Fibrisoma montanum TaxID=2305895 RepID=A0A418M3A6_9BACT|nr:phage integrase SAM-like domain-containing protein [Fibrisoma montanum]RIV20306.1 hypothetical protein DYU11_19845 [Fibrisoma montanum]
MPLFFRLKMAISVRYRPRTLARGKRYARVHNAQLYHENLSGIDPGDPLPLQVIITVNGVEDGGFYLKLPESGAPPVDSHGNPMPGANHGEVVTVNRHLWDQKAQGVILRDAKGRTTRQRNRDVELFNDRLERIKLEIKDVLLTQERRHAAGQAPAPTTQSVKEEWLTGTPYQNRSIAPPLDAERLLTVTEAYQGYLVYLYSLKDTEKAARPRTIEHYTCGLNHLKRYLEREGKPGLRCEVITAHWGKRYQHYLVTAYKMRINTANQYVHMVRTALSYYVEEGKLVRNGLSDLKLDRSDDKEVVWLTDAEVAAVWAMKAPGAQGVALWWFKLILATGMDLADCQTYIDNQDAHEVEIGGLRKITIRRAKTGEWSHIPITGNDRLEELLRGPIPAKMGLDSLNIYLKFIGGMLNLAYPLTTKIGRKTAGALFLKRYSIKAVSRILGHKTVSMTEKYYVKVSGNYVDLEMQLVNQ